MLYGSEPKIDGNWYYFDTCLGTMQTGFLQLPGKMVFYDQNTGKMLYEISV